MVLVAAVWLSTALPIQAQLVFDAAKDFSSNQNPNGAWSYGWWPTGSQEFRLFGRALSASALQPPPSSSQIWVWHVPNSTGSWAIDWLSVACNTSTQTEFINHMDVPSASLHLHPGPNDENSVVRWTAPASGVADLTVIFEGLNPNGTTTEAHVWHNGNALYEASVNGFGESSRVAFQRITAVVVGDVIDFGVGYGNGSYTSDSTLLSACVQLTPAGAFVHCPAGSRTVWEKDGAVRVGVLRLGPELLDQEVTVDYATVEVTAQAGSDYVQASGTLRFAPGETNKVLTIPILDDSLEEPEKQFQLRLSNPSTGVSMGNSNVVIRIQDDEMLFYDDFESYLPGFFPGNGWTLVYGGAGPEVQRIEAPPGGRSGQAFHMTGVSGWVARAYHPVELPPRFTMECLLYSGEGAGFGAYNPALGPWGDHYATVVFLGGQIQALLRAYQNLGQIDILYSPLIPYQPNTWYRIRSVVDLASRSFDVYVDDQRVGQGLPILEPGLPSGLEASSSGSFWLDEVKVVTAMPQAPLSLQPMGIWRSTSTNAVNLVQAFGKTVFVGTDNGTTHSLDISDPAKPMLAGTWESLLTPSSLCIRSNLAFIAGWETDVFSTVEAVDFTDAAHPVLRHSFDTPGYAHGITTTDRNAFVADGDNGLIILDISDPTALRQVGHYPTRGPLTHIALNGMIAYLGLEGGLIILDITDSAKPVRVGAWSTSNPIRDLAVQGTTVFVLEAGKGLEILDAREPGNPALLGSNGWVMDAVALDVQGDFVFLANGTRGLQVIDVSHLAKPEWVAGYATTGPAQDVVASGNQIWVAAAAQGLLGFELLDRRIQFQQPKGPGSLFSLSWQADAGWQLQNTPSLEKVNWQAVPTTETTNRITVPEGGGGGFYRLVKP